MPFIFFATISSLNLFIYKFPLSLCFHDHQMLIVKLTTALCLWPKHWRVILKSVARATFISLWNTRKMDWQNIQAWLWNDSADIDWDTEVICLLLNLLVAKTMTCYFQRCSKSDSLFNVNNNSNNNNKKHHNNYWKKKKQKKLTWRRNSETTVFQFRFYCNSLAYCRYLSIYSF